MIRNNGRRAKRKKLDINLVTLNAQTRVKGMEREYERFHSDSDKSRRKTKGECKCCYYLVGKMGGAAMTNWFCSICSKENTAGSTCTPTVCKECSDAHGLCTHCGGDIEMKIRRKPRNIDVVPFPEKEETTGTPKGKLFLLPNSD